MSLLHLQIGKISAPEPKLTELKALFKVEENKVPSFFTILYQWLRYVLFLLFQVIPIDMAL